MANAGNTPNETTIKTDVLVVGAGPAGASLASFLAYHGIKGIMISRDNSTAYQPRAHYTNPGAWECFRDIGIEAEIRKVAMPREYYGDYRYAKTLAGGDIMRMRSFGQVPQRLGDYQEASPCEHGDVGQNLVEPVLVKYASQHGFQMRFNNKFISYQIDEKTGLIVSTIEDQLAMVTYRIESKYLCGADGAGSKVAAQTGLPYNVTPSGGLATNIWFEADLAHLYSQEPGLLHAVFTPDIERPDWGISGISRVIRPYTEFLFGLFAAPGVTSIHVTDEEVIKRLQELIGDDTVDIKLKGVSQWKINESYAEVISKGNVFCLGDAIHRHPPGNGLGSNTCVQDAYNLAWKLAYVLKGKAGPQILDSYNVERQPVAKRIVKIANDTIRYHGALAHAMGVMEPTVEGRKEAIKELSEATTEGQTRRAAVRKATADLLDETTGLGAEMNQAYASDAVYVADETEARPTWKEDHTGVRHHIISTYPGSRLPHAWLGTQRYGRKVSTQDIAGKGEFTLLTGIGGKSGWSEAARAAEQATGGSIKINVRSIGFGQDYTDPYDTWMERRGVDEDGAVFVRPDRTVAWRCKKLDASTSAASLTNVLKSILRL